VNTAEDSFALLDDQAAGASSRFYTGFVHEHRCVDPGDLDVCARAVAADLTQGLHGILIADYEWGAKLVGAGMAKLQSHGKGALRVLMYRRLALLEQAEVEGQLDRLEHDDAALERGAAEPGPVALLDLVPTIERSRFEHDIGRIQDAIARGETYQVNYTYRWSGRLAGSPLALYRRLRKRQAVRYGALLKLPPEPGDAVHWVLSRSPELFVRNEGGRLITQPMKGTLPRSPVPESDGESARLLHEDVKNRAENLMIVDLLRNDLGRVAELGSVQVPDLFAVQSLATVFQMTSTVTARLRREVDLAALLRALFPCGSITGAPKHRTMDWIAELETSPRGLYCGAIGWLGPGADAPCPDLCLSVAIRTVTLGGAAADGTRPLALGTGGGIVADSRAAEEWDESRWKARFLTTLAPGFELFETMRAENGRIALLQRHQARLASSARVLGFAFDPAAFEALLARLPGGLRRVRVTLNHEGRLTLAEGALLPLPHGPAMLRLASTPLPADRLLPGHKTTLRAAYDAGVRAAEEAGAFDTLFFDASGHLLEGGRSSLFVKLGGRWFTPPVSAGLLPGVMRAALLEDPAFAASERPITRDELLRAEALMACNALRGAMAARLP